MKQVILENYPFPVVSLSRVNYEKFYGVDINGEKGFIMKPKFLQNSDYTVFCAQRLLTKGNGWDFADADSLNECIENLIKDGNKVFEFESHKDFFNWLAE